MDRGKLPQHRSTRSRSWIRQSVRVRCRCARAAITAGTRFAQHEHPRPYHGGLLCAEALREDGAIVAQACRHDRTDRETLLISSRTEVFFSMRDPRSAHTSAPSNTEPKI